MALERLQKVLAAGGLGSRRYCETLIAEGRVRVNGKVAQEPGTKVDPERDEVTVDGSDVRLETPRYYLLHKPKGAVCTNRPRRDETGAARLVDAPHGERLFCVGRLDADSQGAILVTNDGAFANLVSHPRYGVEKTYRVVVNGRADAELVEHVRRGVHLAEGKTAPSKVHIVKRGRDLSVLSITLREGLNRHLRRMFAHLGLDVADILRLRIGDVQLGKLRPGESRALSPAEVQHLRELALEGARAAPPAGLRRRGGGRKKRGGAPRGEGARKPRVDRDHGPRGGRRGDSDRGRGGSRG